MTIEQLVEAASTQIVGDFTRRGIATYDKDGNPTGLLRESLDSYARSVAQHLIANGILPDQFAPAYAKGLREGMEDGNRLLRAKMEAFKDEGGCGCIDEDTGSCGCDNAMSRPPR